MKFGLGPYRLRQHSGAAMGAPFQMMLEQARLAQDRAFDSVWVGETHFSTNGACPAPFVPAAALAVNLDALRIGVFCSLGLTHPIYTAEDAATLDNLSNGRLIVAAGKPLREDEWLGYGIPHEPGDERFAESVDVLRLGWAPQPFSFQGKHFRVPAQHPGNQYTRGQQAVSLTPKPAQLSIPLWIAASDEHAVREAASQALPIVGLPWDDLGRLGKWLDQYQAIAGGRRPENGITALIRHTYVAATDEEATSDLQEPLGKLLEEYQELLPERGLASQQELLELSIAGSIETCIQRLYEYRDRLGVNYVICDFDWPDLSLEKVLRAIDLFGKAVISEFRMVNFPREIRQSFVGQFVKAGRAT